MTEQVAENIYRISVPLPNNPLRELNSYFLRGTDRDLLIDTGFRCEECRQALQGGLDELGSDPARRDMLLTHAHSDHSGMADMFAGPDRQIYMSRIDIEHTKHFLSGERPAQSMRRFLSEGFPQEEIDYVFAHNPARILALPSLDPRFRGLSDGDVIDIGTLRLKTMVVPGHTPGNSIFWLEEQKILFSGDHVLFDITPNITSWPEMPDALGSYICGLRAVRGLPVELALPGHRKTGEFHARVAELLGHHAFRLGEALRIVTENPGLCAYDITGHMTWRIRSRSWEDFPLVQKWFAVGECLSHLDYLRTRGFVTRQMNGGIWRYTVTPAGKTDAQADLEKIKM